MSRQSIHQLVDRKILKVDAEGLIDLEEARHAIATQVRPGSKTTQAVLPPKEASAVQASAPAAEGKDDDKPEDTSLHVAKTIQATAEAKMAQIKLRQLEGSLVPLAEATRMVFTAFRTLRDAVLNVPARVKDQCAAEQDPMRIEHLIEAELEDALNQFSAEKALRDSDEEELDDDAD